jgi:DNA repair exonuclease SbcCD ATPase subunit
MVFGFGKKKTQEQQPAIPAQTERKISLDDIPGILREIETPQLAETVEIAKTTKEDVEAHRKKILGLILHLESDDLKLDDVDKNLGAIVKRGKNAIVSTIKKETSTTLTSATKYDQAVLLNLEISQMLKKMGDVLGHNSRIIHIFAKKYADNLKEEIAKVAKSRNHLQSSINTIENFRAESKKMSEQSQKISEQRASISQKNYRLSEIELETKSLKDAISSLEKQIHGMKSSEVHAKFLEIKGKIDSMSSEKSDVKSVIDLQFSKISRPLGRYSYISSFEKPVRMMMDELLSNPYDVISQHNRNSIIQILEAVEKSIISGSISVKDSEKSVEQVQETISRLDEFMALKEAYSKKVSTLEKDLTIFDIKSLESKEHDLHKARTDITNMERVKKKLDEEVNDDNRTLAKNILDLESDITRLIGSRVLLK